MQIISTHHEVRLSVLDLFLLKTFEIRVSGMILFWDFINQAELQRMMSRTIWRI